MKRLISLDFFRGITIAGMIIVNDPGSWSHVYAPLLHAEWHGATPTDLVFPFFLFIVGVSITLSLSKLKSNPTSTIYIKILEEQTVIDLEDMKFIKLQLLSDKRGGWGLHLKIYHWIYHPGL